MKITAYEKDEYTKIPECFRSVTLDISHIVLKKLEGYGNKRLIKQILDGEMQ